MIMTKITMIMTITIKQFQRHIITKSNFNTKTLKEIKKESISKAQNKVLLKAANSKNFAAKNPER